MCVCVFVCNSVHVCLGVFVSVCVRARVCASVCVRLRVCMLSPKYPAWRRVSHGRSRNERATLKHDIGARHTQGNVYLTGIACDLDGSGATHILL